MSSSSRLALAFVFLTILSIVPLPIWANNCRPAFVFVGWVYVRLFVPECFSLVAVFVHGLILDSLLFNALGVHACAMISALWVINDQARRVVFFNMFQQMLLVFVVTTYYGFLRYIIDWFIGENSSFITIPLLAIASSILWPWLRFSLDDFLQPAFKGRAT